MTCLLSLCFTLLAGATTGGGGGASLAGPGGGGSGGNSLNIGSAFSNPFTGALGGLGGLANDSAASSAFSASQILLCGGSGGVVCGATPATSAKGVPGLAIVERVG